MTLRTYREPPKTDDELISELDPPNMKSAYFDDKMNEESVGKEHLI